MFDNCHNAKGFTGWYPIIVLENSPLHATEHLCSPRKQEAWLDLGRLGMARPLSKSSFAQEPLTFARPGWLHVIEFQEKYAGLQKLLILRWADKLAQPMIRIPDSSAAQIPSAANISHLLAGATVNISRLLACAEMNISHLLAAAEVNISHLLASAAVNTSPLLASAEWLVCLL